MQKKKKSLPIVMAESYAATATRTHISLPSINDRSQIERALINIPKAEIDVDRGK